MIQFNVDLPGVIQDCIRLWSLKRYFLICVRRMVFLFPEKMTIHLHISGLPYDSQVSIQSLSQRFDTRLHQSRRDAENTAAFLDLAQGQQHHPYLYQPSAIQPRFFLLTIGIQLVNKIPDILLFVPPQQSLTFTFHELMQFPVFIKPNDMCFWPSLSPVRQISVAFLSSQKSIIFV